jgi:4-carboxymuconolactone decarboxylase
MVVLFAGDASAQQSAPQGSGKKGELEIIRNGSQLASDGSADNFTGSVRVSSRFQRSAPARVGGGVVTFEPGARTAWHTHPLEQTLIVLSGVGLVQRKGGSIETMRAGDVVWIPPDTKHWLEKVTDEQYKEKEQAGAAVTR